MNWNVRYAHEGKHPWPSEDKALHAIRHLSTHHQPSFKQIVQDIKAMLAEGNVPEQHHQEMVNRLLPDMIMDSVNSGEVGLPALLATHDEIHDREDRPDRGFDVSFSNDSAAVASLKSQAQKDHTHE
jgi:hypothetical protein